METRRDTHSVQCDVPPPPDSLTAHLVVSALRIEDLVTFMSVSKHFREFISESFGEKIGRFRTYATHSYTSGTGSTLWMCAIKGHFEELVWLIDKRSASAGDIIWNDYVIFKAAAHRGHLNILKYLVNRVGPLTLTTSEIEMLIEKAKEKCDVIRPHERDIEIRKQEAAGYLVGLKMVVFGQHYNAFLHLTGASELKYVHE